MPGDHCLRRSLPEDRPEGALTERALHGDLSGEPIFNLACPKSLIGPVDVYLVAHHGGADNSAPALFAAFKPRVAIMNNGLKKGGGFIPGIRPGSPTAGYLSHVVSRLTVVGSLYLAAIALTTVVAIAKLGATAQFALGGTSILIMVGVALDTVKQIESQLQQRNYEGFLRW